MDFRTVNPIRPRPERRTTSTTVGIAAAALVVPPLLIGAVLYASLADPFAGVRQSTTPDATRAAAFRPPEDTSLEAPASDVMARPAVAVASVPVASVVPAPVEAATSPPAAPAPARHPATRRHAQQRPPQQPPLDAFQQRVKGLLEDLGMVPRSDTADADR